MILYTVLISLLSPVFAIGQTLPDEFSRAQSAFARAQRLMREKDYPAASDAYRELVRGFKNSQYRDIYQYGLARSLYHLGDFKQSEKTLISYSSLYPNSYLLPYAHHLLANCQYRRGRLESSFRNYILAYKESSDKQLRRLSKRSLFASIEAGYFPTDSVLHLIPGDIACQIKARVAFLMKGYWGEQSIDSFMAGCSKDLYQKQDIPKATKGKLSVGVMVPLSGPYSKYGQMILDGAMLAAEELKSQYIAIEILAYDTKADNVTAARQAFVLSEAMVDLIIGPLLSNVAATTAAALSGKTTPLLVPAATQAGFTDLSRNSFQLSANMQTIGRGMAQYAVKNRGMTTLAVISPTSIDELTMAESFVREVKRLGARVLAFERFRPGETDFGPYIRDIKEAVMGSVDDSTFFVTLKGDTLRPGEVAVEFDGVFIPATEQQLFLILPQFDFYRVNASYLGTDEWNSPKVLKLGEKVIKDVVFYSSKGAVVNSIGYEEFATAYDSKYGIQPDRLAALGYDGIMLLAQAQREGKRGPGDVAEFLRALSGYEATSGRITFGYTRSNLEVPLFSYEDGKIKPLIERIIIEAEDDSQPPDTVGTEYFKYEY
ncbi:MAG: penicillin-binding protein activator [candidate division Zixibacteria bacterium]|nr:penicillin-binding protein activator [candidate division Zixibacteria bacterium]